MRAMTSSMSSTATKTTWAEGVAASTQRSSLRVVELRQLKPAVSVRGPHECDLDANAIQSDDAIHPVAIDRCQAAVELRRAIDRRQQLGLV